MQCTQRDDRIGELQGDSLKGQHLARDEELITWEARSCNGVTHVQLDVITVHHRRVEAAPTNLKPRSIWHAKDR